MEKALLITAHPDDNAIFAAQFQLFFKNLQWFELCLTARKDTVRSEELFAWQGLLGGQVILGQFADDENDLKTGKTSWNLNAVSNVILAAISDLKPSIILTHNHLGEYGHPHHITTNQIVCSQNQKNVVHFGYGIENPTMILNGKDWNPEMKSIYKSQEKFLNSAPIRTDSQTYIRGL